MSIRLKLALLITFGVTAATAAAGAVFVVRQYASIRAADIDKRRVLMDSVANLAGESLLAKDPLMLLDYLQALRREHKEVLGCRVFMNDKWENVGKEVPSIAPANMIVETTGPAGRKPTDPPLKVEVQFSRAAFEETQRKAFQALLSDIVETCAVVVLGGLLLAFPLSWTLTRRIVRIEAALRDIGQGKFGAKLPALGRDEIARLAQGVNAMSERLQELDKLKKTFVASVTHELRSPLGAIESYVKMLLSDPGRWSVEDRASLERIRTNTTRLTHFVTNLLDMAKIERGKLDFSPRPSDMGELIENTALFFQPNATELGVKLECDADKSLGLVRIDPDLITHVLTNFISNALKFTRRGGTIKVSLRRLNGGLECAVADSGVGIPAESLARIFAPFERVKNPLRATGVGLGLAISKSIIEMHGGTIGVQSEVGKGSRFHFIIPAGQAQAAPAPARA